MTRGVVAELTRRGRVKVAELTCLGAELTTGAELTMNQNLTRYRKVSVCLLLIEKLLWQRADTEDSLYCEASNAASLPLVMHNSDGMYVSI